MKTTDWTLREALSAFVRANAPHRSKSYIGGHRLLGLLGRRASQLQHQGLGRDEILVRLIDELATPAQSGMGRSASLRTIK